MIYDCIVVGGGPAGMLSALQLKRASLRILLVEKKELGGLLRNAQKVENYFGLPSGLSGQELVERMKKQISDFNVPIFFDEVLEIKKKSMFEVKTKTRVLRAKTVVIASGTKPKGLRLKGLNALLGKRAFYERVDLPKMSSPKKIMIIGGGDVGVDYALQLFQDGHHPFLVTRARMKALPILIERAKKCRIPLHENVELKTLPGDWDFVLIAVGREPCLPSLKIPKKTSGLFFAGDVYHSDLRQVHIATGDAMRAAMNVIRFLS